MNAREILARKVKALMAGSKYTNVDKLGAASGVKPRTVGYLISGKGNPTLKTIEAIAGVFKLQAWELLIDHNVARDQIMGRIFGSGESWRSGQPDRRNGDRRENGGDG